MKDKPVYFLQGKNKLSKAEKAVYNDAMEKTKQRQGSFTDHNMSPYKLRCMMEPLHGDELEAFEWVIQQYDDAYSERDYVRLREAIDFAIEDEWFFIDEKGMLRVSEEMPDGGEEFDFHWREE